MPTLLRQSVYSRLAGYEDINDAERLSVVAKVKWHQEELFSRVGFIVTTMSAKLEGVVHFYNGRGTTEQWIKEGKYALNWTRLSCKRFISNQVRLWLFVLAYNLGNFLRRLVLPKKIKHWLLCSLLVKLIKIGAKVVRHSRYITFQMAEVAIDKRLFAEILIRSLTSMYVTKFIDQYEENTC